MTDWADVLGDPLDTKIALLRAGCERRRRDLDRAEVVLSNLDVTKAAPRPVRLPPLDPDSAEVLQAVVKAAMLVCTTQPGRADRWADDVECLAHALRVDPVDGLERAAKALARAATELGDSRGGEAVVKMAEGLGLGEELDAELVKLADERAEWDALTDEERGRRLAKGLGDAFERSHAAIVMAAKWQLDVATRAEPGLHEAARAAREATTKALEGIRQAAAERDAQRARTDAALEGLRAQAKGG